MKKLLLTFVALLGFTAMTYSQSAFSGTISGNVSGISSPVLVFTTLYDGGTTIIYQDSAFTDSLGFYIFNYSGSIPGLIGSGHAEAYITDCNGVTQWDSASWDTLTLQNPVIDTLVYCRTTPPACAANFSYSTAGLTANFTNLSTGSALSYDWNFGDGSTPSSATNPSHTYAAAGTYNVTLYVWNSTCSDTIVSPVTVTSGGSPCGVVADFTALTSGLTANFTDASTGAFSYSWSFGDGSSSSLANPSHTYASAGTYAVSLAVWDSLCGDTIVKNITVVGNPGGLVLSGDLLDSSLIMGDAVVYLITADTNNFLTAVATQSITSGSYAFNVSPGTYYVKAALTPANPNYATYLPTYHSSSLTWSTATAVVVTTTSLTADINMVAGINPGGPGFIGGLVSAGANKTAGPGDPVEDASVILTDENGVGVAHTTTNASGEYEFDNLAYGTYKVFVEVIGKTIHDRTIVLSADNEREEGANFIINKREVVTGVTELNNNISFNGLSPNPATDLVKVNLNITEPVNARLILTDLIGHEVIARDLSLQKGNQTVQLDVQSLPKGIYLVNVISNNVVKTSKLIKY